jgi:Na+/melibiose symporter-like transporter
MTSARRIRGLAWIKRPESGSRAHALDWEDDVEGRVAARNARLYLSGLAASLLGDSAMSLVAGIWVKALTGSSAEAGLVSACMYAPSLLGPFAGLVVDHVNRQRWLVAVNLISAGTILILLGVRSRAQVWLIFVAMSAYGVELVLIDPAESALFAEMLPHAIRERLNGWRLGIQETGRLVAPLLGAGLFALLGGGSVAALDAATFLIAATTTSMLRVPRRSAPPERERWRAELTAGARHIWSESQLRHVVIAATAVMAISGIGVAAQYSLVSGLGQRPAFLGVLTAALGAGSIIAALASGRTVRRVGERSLATAGLVNFAAGNLLRATGWLPAAVLGSAILGFALPWVYLAALNVTQRKTPNFLQGRAAAAITLALFGPQAPMQALGALVITHASYREIYVASAAATAMLAVWLATRSDVRRHARAES